MLIKNTQTRFGLVAILLHWTMALLMIGMLILGLYMVDLPISLEKLNLYGWHKEIGLLVLALVLFRLYWRLINTLPRLDIPLWEIIAARLMHWTFYVFMFAMPLTGWLLTSAAGLPVSFFGLFTLPNLVAPSEDLRILFTNIHYWLSFALIAAIAMHSAAALKHHFINKDDVLKRMIKP